jgi:hypothetical protein
MAPTQIVLSNQSPRRHLQDASINSNSQSVRRVRIAGKSLSDWDSGRPQISLKARLALRELLGQIRLESGTHVNRRAAHEVQPAVLV